MNKFNKKADKPLLDRESRAAKIAFHQAKIRSYSKDLDLEYWMDLDNDFAMSSKHTYFNASTR